MIKIPKKLEVKYIPTCDSSNRFNTKFINVPEYRILFINPSNSQVFGFLVIDSTKRGPGVGGIRIAKDLSLVEMGRLAYSMTLKNSAACLPFGGAKAGFSVDPVFIEKQPELKLELINIIAEALFPFDSYISAPDMGTDEEDIQSIFNYNSTILGSDSHARGGLGRNICNGGIPIDKWELTAHGLVRAITELENFDRGIQLKGSRVVIQGYGNVGAPVAKKLRDKGCLIVGASDINMGIWNSKGLDIEELNNIRNNPGGLSNYSGKTERTFNLNQIDWLLEAPCDILVPAARPDAITARNADRIQCKAILEGANTPISKVTEYYLFYKHGITSLPDFIVNSGGIIGCAVEFKMNTNRIYKKKVNADGVRLYIENLINSTISKNVKKILNCSNKLKKKDSFPRDKAFNLAMDRLNSPTEFWL